MTIEQLIATFNTHSNKILGLGEKLGAYIIPAVILGAIALLLFAKNSYRLFKFVLPLAGVALGAIAGASLLTPYLNLYLPVVANYVNPFYLTGLVSALVIAFFCFRFHNFTVIVIGASVGFVVVGRIAKNILLSFPLVSQLATTLPPVVVYAVGTAIGILCMVVCAVVIKKYFRGFYILTTSIGGAVVALGAAALFIFATTTYLMYAVLGAVALGTLIGIVFSAKQMLLASYDD